MDSLPHGFCLLWSQWLIAFHIFGNMLTVIAYIGLPLGLVVLLWTNSLRFFGPWLLSLFAAFILLCGLTHAVNILVIFRPYYIFQSVVEVVTGLVSVVTLIFFWKRLAEYRYEKERHAIPT